jgi:23S rRNA pseudouridine2457 synthase
MTRRLIAFNKPCGVVCQFSTHPGHRSLADYIDVKDVYAAGRLDTDSEGLLLLTADGALQHAISVPRSRVTKTYWAQIEGNAPDEALTRLRSGLDLGDFFTQPCTVQRLNEAVGVWPRDPPIRFRKSVPTSWLEIGLTEGKNRQVRRMTAKIGFPTLRLIRIAIGPYSVEGLAPGAWREVDPGHLLPTIKLSRHPTGAVKPIAKDSGHYSG